MTKARENSDYTGLQGDLALKSTVASPVFTGNVGIGVTPEATHSLADVLQVGGTALIANWEDAETYVGENVYISTAGTYKYLTTSHASLYNQNSGKHVFNVAPSGTADAAISFTNAMTIDNAGIVTKPLQPIISVSRDNSSLSFTTNQDVFASTSMLNWVVQGISHDTSNGRFTVPVAGKYYVHFQSMKNSGAKAYFRVYKNGGDTLGLRIYDDTTNISGWCPYGLGGVFSLAANDYLNVVCGEGATNNAHGMNHMNFTIHLIG